MGFVLEKSITVVDCSAKGSEDKICSLACQGRAGEEWGEGEEATFTFTRRKIQKA